MRALPLLVLAASQLFAADPQSEHGHAFEELVLADLRRPFPTDVDLSKRFADHRKEFEQLVTMAKADNEVMRIAPDFTFTTTSAARAPFRNSDSHHKDGMNIAIFFRRSDWKLAFSGRPIIEMTCISLCKPRVL